MCLENADCYQYHKDAKSPAMQCFLMECGCSAGYDQGDRYCVERSKFIEQQRQQNAQHHTRLGVCLYIILCTARSIEVGSLTSLRKVPHWFRPFHRLSTLITLCCSNVPERSTKFSNISRLLGEWRGGEQQDAKVIVHQRTV